MREAVNNLYEIIDRYVLLGPLYFMVMTLKLNSCCQSTTMVDHLPVPNACIC